MVSARQADPPIYAEVRRKLRVDPLKPNRLSAQVERASQRFERKRNALKALAEGEVVVLVTKQDTPQAFVMQ